MSSLYITSVVGAGFATGQEINKFFTAHGVAGFYGVAIATLLFCALGCMVLKKVYVEGAHDMDDFLVPRVGGKISGAIKIITAVFQFFVFIIMQSGMKTLLVEAGVPAAIAYCIVFILLVVAISHDIRRLMSINSAISPIIISGIIFLGVILFVMNKQGLSQIPAVSYNIAPDSAALLSIPSGSWLLSSILYVSFNTLLSLPVLSDAGKTLVSKKASVAGGILGGAFIGVMALSTHLTLYAYKASIIGKEMPMVYLSFKLGNIPGIIYGVVIFCAMFCSASACGYCTVDHLNQKLPFKRFVTSIIVCLLSIPLSVIKFATLIGFFYPLFGVAGVFVLLIVLFK